ncbi:MAG: sugar nucleotide-binding protein [Lachnospiraceae bacterium]|nr:sugar nucleotide-binding protein [Lachnospiraceae bacterium]
MKKLLVTGASGFVGSRTVEFYREKYEVYAPFHREMDITNQESVYTAFESFQPDYVVHCAAISDIGRCDREPEQSWKINVDGSRNIAKASRQYGAKCLVCSSDQVYQGSSWRGPHREEEQIEPVNLYGREKKRAEEECLRENPECVMLRLSWMYDAHRGNGKVQGDFFTGLLSGLKGTEILRYPIYDIRGITDVNEVVKNLEKAFDLKGGIYNFGSSNDRNTYETVLAMFEGLGWDADRIGKNERAFAEQPRDISMDQEKLNVCGIVFTPTVEALIRNGQAYG